jgi:hypothetical protein
VRSQNLFTRTDVPSDVSIGQRTIGEWPNEQRPKRNQKDQVANRRKKETRPTLAGFATPRGSIRSPLICRNHEVAGASGIHPPPYIWMSEKHQATGSDDVPQGSATIINRLKGTVPELSYCTT